MELEFDGIEFTAPAGWKQVPIPAEKRGFIDAQVLVPAGDEELVLTLSSIGGGIDSNIERWKSQFVMEPGGIPVVEPIDIGSKRGKWVDLRGTFQGEPGKRMLGVCIPAEPRDFYLKLTGPADAVEKVREPLRSFVATARFSR